MFEVSYASNDFPYVTFTTPVDAALNPITSWTTHAVLRTSAGARFVVTGTAPLPVRLTNVVASTGQLQFSFAALAGQPYTIQARTNLASGSWLDLTNVTGDGTLQQFTFPTTNPPARFFRVRSDSVAGVRPFPGAAKCKVELVPVNSNLLFPRFYPG